MSAQGVGVLCSSLLVIEFIWIVEVEIRRYRKRRAELDIYANAIKIQPTRLRFAFSLIVFGILSLISLSSPSKSDRNCSVTKIEYITGCPEIIHSLMDDE